MEKEGYPNGVMRNGEIQIGKWRNGDRRNGETERVEIKNGNVETRTRKWRAQMVERCNSPISSLYSFITECITFYPPITLLHIKFDGTFLSIHHLAAHPTSGERH
ncbi:hypothetical protein TNCV_4145841 [Trichonephila clavipes]|nr:hypothetical protein TNCV_4145841 [Trichonephila clavipes]